jgi:hypothetical protein
MYDPAINHRTSRPVLDGAALDSAIDEARAELAALLRAPGGGEPSRLTGARALLGSLLDRRVALTAARLDDRDARTVAAARADRNEAIAVTGAQLYWLPAGDAAWPEVALTLGRLSYDRYTDPWPDAEPPDPTTSTQRATCCCAGRATRTPTSAPPCTCSSRSATGGT